MAKMNADFMNGVKQKYTCLDSDCAQYMAKISDTRYSYIEYREWFGKYIVCHAVVDLQDYSLSEIMQFCSTYYSSLEEIVKDYGFRGALQIMSECIFEQLDLGDMEFTAEQKSEGSAIKFIHEWMKERLI